MALSRKPNSRVYGNGRCVDSPLTRIVTNGPLIKSVKDNVPKETRKINIEALKKGLELAE